MPYIGRELDSGNYLKLDDISSSFNGSLTTFNLTAGNQAFFPGSAFSILVVLAGVVQEPEAAYNINQSQITFASAPLAGDQFFCISLGVPLGINVPGNGTVNGAQLAKPFNYDGYFYLDDANNRVGVGTATPQKPLHVVGEGQFDSVRILGDLTIDGTTTTLDTVVTEVDKLEVGANNSTVGVAITQSGSGDILNLYDGASSVFSVADGGTVTASGDISIADKIIHTGDTNTAIRFPADDTFTVETGGSERLRVTSVGRVGINSTSPGSLLDVVGAGGIKISNPGGIAHYYLNNGSSQWDIQSDNTTQSLIIEKNNSEYFRITSGGSVGIGTDSPQSQFEVFGSSPVVRSKNTTNQTYTEISNDGTDGYLDWSSGSLILRGASNTERLRIASDGVITINTVPATNNNANQAVLFQTAAGAIHGGSGLLYNPAEDTLKVNGNIISSNSFFGAGAGPLMLAVANYSSTQYIKVSNKIEIKGNVGINEANPAVSLDLASNTDAVSLPTGTTAQRPSGTDAYIRKNSTNNALEFYNGTNWVEIITDYFPTGSTTLG